MGFQEAVGGLVPIIKTLTNVTWSHPVSIILKLVS